MSRDNRILAGLITAFVGIIIMLVFRKLGIAITGISVTYALIEQIAQILSIEDSYK